MSSFSKSSARLKKKKEIYVPHRNAKPAFSKFSGLNGVFEKLHFGDGLVWTVGLAMEKMLRIQISPAYCGRGPSFYLNSKNLDSA